MPSARKKGATVGKSSTAANTHSKTQRNKKILSRFLHIRLDPTFSGSLEFYLEHKVKNYKFQYKQTFHVPKDIHLQRTMLYNLIQQMNSTLDDYMWHHYEQERIEVNTKATQSTI